jgi:[NiFe] hydrogenase diaphorase moiety large subunit
MFHVHSASQEETLYALLEKWKGGPGDLLQALIDVQHSFHHVPPDVLSILSEQLKVPLVRVKGLVSFYSFLSIEPQGEIVIHFSDNITDQMLGNRELASLLCARLGVRLGETRKDGRVSVHLTSCTGMCDQGPAALVNYMPVTRLDLPRIENMANLIEASVPLEDWPREFFAVETQMRRSDVVFRTPMDPGSGLRASLARGGERLPAWAEDLAPSDARRHHLERGGAETLKEIYRSGLRGRGGAGFKTGIKWESVRNGEIGSRYVLCNADEGEPGTFKDRVLLTDYADAVFEGMTICGHVVGAKLGILYIRQEMSKSTGVRAPTSAAWKPP